MSRLDCVATFQRPITAYHGKTRDEVLILATGDVEGQSPSYLAVAQDGKSLWGPIEDFTISPVLAREMQREGVLTR